MSAPRQPVAEAPAPADGSPPGAPRPPAATPAAKPAPVVALRGVGRRFGAGDAAVWALRDVDLTVGPGDFVAIMGASGSGKSTLMNLLGLLDKPTCGTYALMGRSAAELGDDARAALRGQQLGFVFQSFHLLPRTSALENVALPLLYRGLARAERVRRAEAALVAVGLGHRLHHVPSQLSGGQQQRVALARALVGKPALLLADEPTGNLDSTTSLEVMAQLQRLNDDGLTVVLVTHEPDIAAHARRVVHFRDGRLVHDAPVPTAARRRAVAGGVGAGGASSLDASASAEVAGPTGGERCTP